MKNAVYVQRLANNSAIHSKSAGIWIGGKYLTILPTITSYCVVMAKLLLHYVHFTIPSFTFQLKKCKIRELIILFRH